ncbi:MAG: PstS family phosphate ABC transporter substrate-binding protein [Alphaproteobacteria bacterium]
MNRFSAILLAVLTATAVAAPSAGSETTATFADMPDYQPGSKALEGTLTAIGSDTLGEVMDAWVEAFTAFHGDVSTEIRSQGSQTAVPALQQGRTLLAPMSRRMTKGEEAAFKDIFGYQPTAFIVSLDALAVYVHKDNPIYGLTMGQLDQVFSSTHMCGGDPITRWEELAVGTRTVGRIRVLGRNTVSGTYEFFRKTALCNGAFRTDYVEHEDSAAVIKAVAADINAIGFAGLGYNQPNVRPIAIAQGRDPYSARFFPVYVEKFTNSDDPDKRFAYVLDGRYPLSRPLFIYVNREPGKPMTPLTQAFLDFVLSSQGQSIVLKNGFVPLPAKTLERERRKLAPDYQPRRWWFE